MTDLSAKTRDSGASRAQKRGNPISRFVAFLRLFTSQILDELRKVVRPTRSELIQYTLVVIVFVTIMMALVSGLDYGFTKLVLFMFGG